MGLTFKENCPDLRNTRVVDVIAELEDFGCKVDIHDPWVNSTEAQHEYGVSLTEEPREGTYDAIVLAVAHSQYAEMGAEKVRALGHDNAVVYDLKYLLAEDESDMRL